VCKQQTKAEDLPDPWHCPKCKGDFDSLLNQYLENPQTSIQNRDFCDLCGHGEEILPNSGNGNLIPCKRCIRAFHVFCAGEKEDILEDRKRYWSWECPECSGTAAQKFSWSRLSLPVEQPIDAKEIFVEHKTTTRGQGPVMELEAGDGLGGPEAAPIGRGNKAKGRGAKEGKNRTPAPAEPLISSKAAPNTSVYFCDDEGDVEPAGSKSKKKEACASTDSDAKPRGRGRPRKNLLSGGLESKR